MPRNELMNERTNKLGHPFSGCSWLGIDKALALASTHRRLIAGGGVYGLAGGGIVEEMRP